MFTVPLVVIKKLKLKSFFSYSKIARCQSSTLWCSKTFYDYCGEEKEWKVTLIRSTFINRNEIIDAFPSKLTFLYLLFCFVGFISRNHNFPSILIFWIFTSIWCNQSHHQPQTPRTLGLRRRKKEKKRL